ncbi:hypothetical protein [Campylobacter majalis]|uniref:hypothetical protein n=1 Tax=Campylobacter majalis TaxID=2790656 RepID=UPI003D69609A
MQDKNALNFIYKGKIRAVNPYKILNINGGIWYLFATQNGKIKSVGEVKNHLII